MFRSLRISNVEFRFKGSEKLGPSRNGRMERNFPVIPIFRNFRPTSRGTPKISERNSGKCLFHSLHNPEFPEFLVEWKAPHITGFVCKRFLPFFPTPSPLTCAIFRVAFAPKQHGNACFAGYTLNDVVPVHVGDSLAITTFDKMELDEFWEQSNSTRSLWHTELISRECWLFSNSKAGKSWEALLDSHSATRWVDLSDVHGFLVSNKTVVLRR